MKLYSYSSDLLRFVDAKWIIAKLTLGGILLGIIILFGAIKLNQSVDSAVGYRSASTLTAENNFLRQQVSLISPRVSKLEIQARQLDGQAKKLHILLHFRKIAGDTVSGLTNAAAGLKSQSSIPAARTFHP